MSPLHIGWTISFGHHICATMTSWHFARERAEGHEFDSGKGGHLRPLALAATCGHLRPLDWLQVAASGCRWKENAGGHWRPLEWLQVAAGDKRMLVATGGQVRPLDWLQVAASGCRWQEDAGGHWRPLDWLQVAASGCRWEENAGGHWRPGATRLAASGCKWLPMRREWWRPLAATRVAASGCKWLPGVGETNWNYISPFILSWAENIGNFPLPAHGKFITFSVGGVLAMWSTVLSSFLCWGSFFWVRHGQYETFYRSCGFSKLSFFRCSVVLLF